MKWRNSKERELLASGGSRDQTLPNKNNPNPDLSDARNDRQPSLSPPSSPHPAGGQMAAGAAGTVGPHSAPAGGSSSNNGSMSPRSDSYGIGGGGGTAMHAENKFAASAAAADGSAGEAMCSSGGSNGGLMGPTKEQLFKYEFGGGSAGDENRAAGHMFNHFYDKLRDVNGLMVAAAAVAGGFAGAAGRQTALASPGAAAGSAAYYDEYDTNSDSDEEISVT